MFGDYRNLLLILNNYRISVRFVKFDKSHMHCFIMKIAHLPFIYIQCTSWSMFIELFRVTAICVFTICLNFLIMFIYVSRFVVNEVLMFLCVIPRVYYGFIS